MIRRVRTSDGLVLYRSDALDAAGVAHGFTTRLGGASPGPRDSLDLGPPDPDADATRTDEYQTNLDRLLGALDRPAADLVRTSQVHGNAVFDGTSFDTGSAPPAADAIITDDARQVLLVRTADCVPILLSDRRGSAVAAVHAGWRGLVAAAPGHTVSAPRARFAVEPGDLVAAIGPCISLERYEVGDEVADAFEAEGLGEAVDRESFGRPHVDVRRAAKVRLLAAGIDEAAIEVSDRCSSRDEGEFYSYRRDGLTGRMGAVIAPRDA